MPVAELYDSDLYAWSEHQAHLLRAEEFEQVDIAHLIEELEGMSSRTRRELVSRLTVLLAHLLKWQFQPGKRSRSWQATIRVQRRSLRQLLDDNPSLRSRLAEFVPMAYASAVDLAWAETGLDADNFPSDCIFSVQQIIQDTYFSDQ